MGDPLRGLAEALASARDGGAAPRPSGAFTPEQGYQVQANWMAMLGEAVLGYKVGLTTSAAQQAMRWNEPIVGRLPARDLIVSPAFVPTARHQRFAEAELIFEIGEDFPARERAFSAADVASRVSGIFAGIELCASRYAHEDVAIAELIADNSNADLLVVGARLASAWDDRFSELPVVLHRRDHQPISGSTASVLGNPLRAVTWLANWLASQGEGLKQGQLVASGSCTGITALDGDEELSADFAGLGTASVTIAQSRN